MAALFSVLTLSVATPCHVGYVRWHIIPQQDRLANVPGRPEKRPAFAGLDEEKAYIRLLLRIDEPVCPGNVIHPLREPVAHVLSVRGMQHALNGIGAAGR